MKYWYEAEVLTAAQGHQLDPMLVKAVTLVESSGLTHAYRYEPGFWLRYMAHEPKWDGANPRRVSASYGLMQTMYTTALEEGYPPGDAPEGLFVPVVGLEYGCRHLARLLRWSNGNVEQALAAYNGGKGGNERPPFRNSHYAQKVLGMMGQL